jgi:hypothetical protein
MHTILVYKLENRESFILESECIVLHIKPIVEKQLKDEEALKRIDID